MSGWGSVGVLHFEGIVFDQRVHKSIISLLRESLWALSLVGAGILGDTTVEFWDEVLELAWNIILKLSLGPVVMKEAAESAVWVGVLWHWASDVRLWVFLDTGLDLSPIVVQEAAEGAIWVSILWHWASDVRLWVLLSIGLNLGPVIMEEAAESAVWMGVLWHWASDVWLRVLRVPDVSFKLSLSPIVVKEAAESAVWMSIFGHWASDIWLRILVSLNLSPVIVEVTRES